MKFLSCEKISEHKYKTPEGYLICIDSILARTGKQTYKRREVFGVDCKDAENEVDVDRTPEEVFSDKTLASFENKPLTMEHPDEDVNIENHNTLSVGFARDIKRGKTDKGEDVMLGTLVFTDADAIEAIENGEMTDLSCGYECDIVDEANPCQRNIRGNHIALCQQGRAGIARIVDSVKDNKSFAKGQKFKNKNGIIVEIIESNDDNDYVHYTINGRHNTVKSESLKNMLDFNEYSLQDSLNDDLSLSPAQKKILLKYGYSHANASKIDELLKKSSENDIADSINDNDDLPEEEDSEFLFRDAYGKEIIVTNWDGKSQFMVVYEGREQLMNRRDVEQFLDRKGAKFSRVLRDSVKDGLIKTTNPEIHAWKERGKYRAQAYNRRNLDYSSLQDIARKCGVVIKESSYDYVDIISDDKSKIYKAFSEVNPSFSVGSWSIIDSVKDEKWYDPEYDRYVTEDVIKKQYEYFKKSPYFNKTYEQFREENFMKTKDSIKDSDKYVVYAEGTKSGNRALYRKRQGSAMYMYERDADEFTEEEALRLTKQKGKYTWVMELIRDSVNDSLREPTSSELKKFEDYLIQRHWRVKKLGVTWTGRIHYEVSKLLQAGDSDKLIINEIGAAEDYSGLDMTYSIGSTGKELKGVVDIDKVYVKDSDTYEEVTKNLKEQAKKEMKDVEKDPSLLFYSNTLLKRIMRTSSNPKEREIAKNELLARGVKIENTCSDSKEDLLSKLRSVHIKEDETFEVIDGQYLLQIQNVGKQELSTRSGPIKLTGSNQSMRLSTKTSSYAWGRIWKNGTLVFNESDALNIIRDKMINFLKTVRDSLKKDAWSGSIDGYFFVYESKSDSYMITSPNGKTYKVKANNLKPEEAIHKVKLVAKDSVKDDRLAPMTYKKLKELGVSKETYAKWSQEQANKYIAAKSKVEKAKSKVEEKEKSSKKTSMSSHLSEAKDRIKEALDNNDDHVELELPKNIDHDKFFSKLDDLAYDEEFRYDIEEKSNYDDGRYYYIAIRRR